jgi:hypothetical protein
MSVLGTFYLLALVSLPVALAAGWWVSLRSPSFHAPKWRSLAYSSGLCAATANLVLFWGFVVWLQFHYTPEGYRVRDTASSVGLFLLLYSSLSLIIGKGPYRWFVGAACILAMLPWIPLGVL